MQEVDPFRIMTDCDKQYSSFIIFYSVLKKKIYVRHPVLLAGVQGYLANGMHIETSGFKNNPVTEHESNDSDRKKKPATFYNKKKLAVLLYLQDNGKIW